MAEEKILICSKLLAQKGLTIAFAESATAGWLCSEFALAPESGQVLKGGIVCYDATLKEDILHVPHELIKTYTPESKEVTEELAKRLASVIRSDIQVGVTGLTGPGGSETDEKPVGTMFISAQIEGRIINSRKVFTGSCEDIIHATVRSAAQLLIDELSERET
jgi:nicotinamide-nucleotide amidase